MYINQVPNKSGRNLMNVIKLFDLALSNNSGVPFKREY